VSVVRACGGEVAGMVLIWETAQADMPVGPAHPVRAAGPVKPPETAERAGPAPAGPKGPPIPRLRGGERPDRRAGQRSPRGVCVLPGTTSPAS
jgi:hypothetical protein